MNELQHLNYQKQKAYLNVRIGIAAWRAYQEGKSKINSEEASAMMSEISLGAAMAITRYAEATSLAETDQAASFLHTISGSR